MIYLNPKNVNKINVIRKSEFEDVINKEDFGTQIDGFKQYGDELWNVANILKIDIEESDQKLKFEKNEIGLTTIIPNKEITYIAYVHFIDGTKEFLCCWSDYEKVIDYIRDFVEKVMVD